MYFNYIYIYYTTSYDTLIGHVDIYVNRGIQQPSCAIPPSNEVNLTRISDLAATSVERKIYEIKYLHKLLFNNNIIIILGYPLYAVPE